MCNKKVLLIYYESWCGHPKDNKLWLARFEDEIGAYDYGRKDFLVKDAIKNNLKYKVLRYHKNGTKTVMETNCT